MGPWKSSNTWPKVISLPGRMHLQEANRKLEQEIGARERLNAPIESPLRRRLTFGFVVAVHLTIFMGFSSWRGARLAADDDDWVAHSYTIMNRIELTSKHVIEMETSARGDMPWAGKTRSLRTTRAHGTPSRRTRTCCAI
jgi:hypothetical protein